MGWSFPAWDPVLIPLPGPLDIRWYGMMYVVAFVVAQIVLTRLAKARFLPIAPERAADLIFYLVIGTVLGGRIGYVLFYDQGLADPIRLVQVWQGGLSFHGGLLGVILAVVLFARRNQVNIGRVLDACALAVTPGIFAVRMANFINGELYGRATTKDTFGAMQFPTDPRATELLGLRAVTEKRDQELAIQYAYRNVEWEDIEGQLSKVDARGDEIPWERIKEQLDWEQVSSITPVWPEGSGVPFRHPSQLYEGIGEGILVGLMLWIVYLATRARPLGYWAFGGLFMIGYGVVRFGVEYLRQPDAQFRDADDSLGTVFLGMTMGQTLCSAMVIVGVACLYQSRATRSMVTAAMAAPDADVVNGEGGA